MSRADRCNVMLLFLNDNTIHTTTSLLTGAADYASKQFGFSLSNVKKHWQTRKHLFKDTNTNNVITHYMEFVNEKIVSMSVNKDDGDDQQLRDNNMVKVTSNGDQCDDSTATTTVSTEVSSVEDTSNASDMEYDITTESQEEDNDVNEGDSKNIALDDITGDMEDSQQLIKDDDMVGMEVRIGLKSYLVPNFLDMNPELRSVIFRFLDKLLQSEPNTNDGIRLTADTPNGCTEPLINIMRSAVLRQQYGKSVNRNEQQGRTRSTDTITLRNTYGNSGGHFSHGTQDWYVITVYSVHDITSCLICNT